MNWQLHLCGAGSVGRLFVAVSARLEDFVQVRALGERCLERRPFCRRHFEVAVGPASIAKGDGEDSCHFVISHRRNNRRRHDGIWDAAWAKKFAEPAPFKADICAKPQQN